MDAGYFDNYGVDLAVMWLIQHRAELLKHCGGVALVELRAFPLQERGLTYYPDGDPEHAEAAGLFADAVAAISTPLQAVFVPAATPATIATTNYSRRSTTPSIPTSMKTIPTSAASSSNWIPTRH